MRAIVAASLVLALARVVAADPHPMGAGQQLAPSAAGADVAIARERLTVRVLLDRIDVRAELTLANRAEAARVVEVGFPCDPRRGAPSLSRLDCQTRVSVKQGGQPVRTKLRRNANGDGDGDWTWTMRFGPRQQVPLRVEYVSKLVNGRYAKPFFGLSTVTYRLTTGATWAGPIGELDMSVEFPVDVVGDISPPGYLRSNRVIVWHFKEYAPTEDVTVTFAPGYGQLWYGLAASRRGAPEVVRDAKAQQMEALIERFARDGAKETIELRQQMQRHHDALPLPPPERVARTVDESVRLLRQSLQAAEP